MFLTLGVFCVVLGGKFATVERFASDLPIWDEWDAGGTGVMLPYFQDRLRLADFFTPHNEHRIVWTKALTLGLVLANGQWDARLECAVNAILHAVLAAAAFAFGTHMLPTRWWLVWCLAIITLMSPPVSWQNAVAGFHSQQYFLLLVSVLTIALLVLAPAWTLRWWLGLGCGAGALVSMGAGLIAPATAVAVLIVDGRPRDVVRRHWPTLFGCALLVALGWWMKVDVPYHATLQARSWHDFVLSFWRNFQWPVTNQVWFGVVAWLPWIALAWHVLARPTTVRRSERVVVAIGLWTIAIYLAAAYARGAGGGWPASRYLDTVTLGIATNVLALLLAVSRPRASSWPKWLWAGGAAVAIAFFAPAYLSTVRGNIVGDLASFRERMSRIETNTRAYLATDDRTWLDQPDIAYPNADLLQEHLSHVELRAILPFTVRPSVPLDGEANPLGSFVPSGVAPSAARSDAISHWGSLSAAGNESTGRWRSREIPPSSFSYWRMEIAHGSSQGKTSLQLAAEGERPLRSLEPAEGRQAGWNAVIFSTPRTVSTLTATDDDTSTWIGFAAPTEIAAGSYWTQRAVGTGWWIVGAGCFLVLFAQLAITLRSPSSSFPHEPGTSDSLK